MQTVFTMFLNTSIFVCGALRVRQYMYMNNKTKIQNKHTNKIRMEDRKWIEKHVSLPAAKL